MPTIRSNLSVPLTSLQKVNNDRMEVDEAVGRNDTSFRPLCVKCGVFGAQNGSGYAEFGNTRVLAQIIGPDSDGKWEEDYAKITVSIKGLDGSRIAACRSQLSSAVSAVIFSNKYPGKVIDIEVTVVSDDGGVLSTALSAVTLAIAHSGIEHLGLMASCHVALLPDGRYVTDPSTSELAVASGGITFAFVPSLGQTTCVDVYGKIPLRAMAPLLEFAKQRATAIVPTLHRAIVQGVKQTKK